MADPTTGISQNGTINSTTSQDQDLQINLADSDNLQESSGNPQEPALGTPGSSVNDLDLNLNLSESQKNNDRLQNEDQKNREEIIAPKGEVISSSAEITGGNPQESSGNPQESSGNPQESSSQASTTIEEIPTFSENSTPQAEVIGGNPLQSSVNPPQSSLQEDMKIIDELEGNKNTGGLAEEAKIEVPLLPVETPKTFDLDAMLGGPANTSIPQAEGIGGNPPQSGVLPAFTIPTSSAILGGNIQGTAVRQMVPQKHEGVKVLLFVVLFGALGFTAFFILKTMYPIEFGNMFAGTTPQMHASSDITGTEEILPGTGEILTNTGIANEIVNNEGATGTESTVITGLENNVSTGDAAFGELNDLGTPTIETGQTDVMRLTDYASQGNDFLAQGRTIGNNTVIKYSLYISKKATSFLEKIANGEQINNLSGYFAQFDQYIIQLNTLVGQPANTTNTQDQASALTPANDIQEVATGTSTTTETGNTSEYNFFQKYKK